MSDTWRGEISQLHTSQVNDAARENFPRTHLYRRALWHRVLLCFMRIAPPSPPPSIINSTSRLYTPFFTTAKRQNAIIPKLLSAHCLCKNAQIKF
ncbi:hypothetical protein POVWA2_037490 [Plasmodium ovale wallikeri]|uniref:Uncharacterized protein n=1 Tax=Plasmodium ovale wallikeri TaxID=864142 RepID=A0A1A8Z4L0_PLAOA|nr:hypothetical protein POVWA1_038510 [Plasmodium ovale wallikeri]SBT39290.1 hypothetical protein POVWA2_037490 [Plasmodium ovale wallikeri]